MAGYLVALDGVTAQALKATAIAIIQGEIEELSAKVCPLPPELSRAVRRRMADDRKREFASTAISYTPLPFVGIEMRRDAAKARMHDQGRYQLLEVDSAPHAVELAKRGKVPPGSVYVGILGAFYSPPNYQPPTEEPDHDAGPTEDDASPADILEPNG